MKKIVVISLILTFVLSISTYASDDMQITEIDQQIADLRSQLSDLYALRNEILISGHIVEEIGEGIIFDDVSNQFIVEQFEEENQYAHYIYWRVYNPFDYNIYLKFEYILRDENGDVISKGSDWRDCIMPGEENVLRAQVKQYKSMEITAVFKESLYSVNTGHLVSYYTAGDNMLLTITNESDKVIYSPDIRVIGYKDGKPVAMGGSYSFGGYEFEPGEEDSVGAGLKQYDSYEILFDGGAK